MIAELREKGIVDVPQMQGAVETLDYLETRTKYQGHVKGTSVAAYPSGSSTCWAPEDVLCAPHFFEFALQLTNVVAGYLETKEPLLYSVNAFTTYPIQGPMNPDIQDWHRDRDDVRFVALFVYLSDVLESSDGAHLFREGTHLGPSEGKLAVVQGPAGTAFLADTRGLHMGMRPMSFPRTMAWARWCVTDPPASYVWDGQAPVPRSALGCRYPADENLRRSIRLVVQ